MAIFPQRIEIEKCVWRAKGVGQVCSLQFIEEAWTAIVVVKGAVVAFQHHLYAYQGNWEFKLVAFDIGEGTSTWLITKRYNWNCFKNDLPLLISSWLEKAGLEQEG